jgi:hypothetical protein
LQPGLEDAFAAAVDVGALFGGVWGGGVGAGVPPMMEVPYANLQAIS